MRIIGFGHRRRVGKDTCAKFLSIILRMKNRDVKKVGFSDELYRICHQLYKWAGFKTKEYYEEHGHLKEVKLAAVNRTPREILIDVGMKMREQDPYVWIDQALRGTHCEFLIMADVRFHNEVSRIKELGGQCIKIERPGIEKFDDPADADLKNWDQWDQILVNDGTLSNLNDQMMTLAENLLA